MSKYKFIKDYTAATRNVSLGPNANTITKDFKKGDVIEGNFQPATEGGTGVVGPMPASVITDKDGKMPQEGMVGSYNFVIPMENLEEVNSDGSVDSKKKKDNAFIIGGSVAVIATTTIALFLDKEKKFRKPILIIGITALVTGGVAYWSVNKKK